jgi:hypothetical protein
VKIIVHGPVAGRDWRGSVESWMPDQEVTIDDADPDAVAWARHWAGSGHVTIVEDAAGPKAASAQQAQPKTASPRTATRPDK